VRGQDLLAGQRRVGNVKNNELLIEPIAARVIRQVVDIDTEMWNCSVSGGVTLSKAIDRISPCSIVDLRTPAPPPGFSA
jgi:hypothetical protein